MNSGGLIQKRILHGSVIFLVLSSLLYVAQNCGQNPSSRLKTLDNFASGSRNLNSCSGNPKLANSDGLKAILSALGTRIEWATEKNRAGILEAINKSFAAVPPAFQTTFMSLGGQIIVSSESNIICTGAERKNAFKNVKLSNSDFKTFSEGLNEVGSCYLFMPPSVYKKENGKDGQFLAIVLPDDPKEIQHSFVRMFGYLTAEMYSHFYFDKKSTSVVWSSVENVNFTRTKEALAAAFLADLNGDENASKFNEYRAGGRASPAERRAFADSVYAEAFDSFFCQAYVSGPRNTRLRMARQFPQTYSKFSGGADAPKFSLTGDEQDQDDDNALSLTTTNKSTKLAALTEALTKSVTRGKYSRTFSNSKKPIIERMNIVNWYKSVRADSIKDASTSRKGGFSLSNPFSEVWEGAGILYGDYYRRTEEATLEALNRRSGGYPGFLGSVASVVEGISAGTGYTDLYQDIQARTNVIYGQVQDGRGTSGPLGILDTASVIANSTVDQIREIPGGIGPINIGSLAGIAQDAVSSYEGGGFDSTGRYKDFSTSERIKSGGSAVIGFLGETGATDFLTEKFMGSGGMIRQLENNPLINDDAQVVFGNSGRALERLNTANTQLKDALDNSEIYKTVTGLGEQFGGPGGFIPTPSSIVDMGAEKFVDFVADGVQDEE